MKTGRGRGRDRSAGGVLDVTSLGNAFPAAGDQSQDMKHVRQWQYSDVRTWVDHILRKENVAYGSLFEKNHIDGSLLLSLTLDQLRDDIGISSLGHRMLLSKAVEGLKSSDDLNPSTKLPPSHPTTEALASTTPSASIAPKPSRQALANPGRQETNPSRPAPVAPGPALQEERQAALTQTGAQSKTIRSRVRDTAFDAPRNPAQQTPLPTVAQQATTQAAKSGPSSVTVAVATSTEASCAGQTLAAAADSPTAVAPDVQALPQRESAARRGKGSLRPTQQQHAVSTPLAPSSPSGIPVTSAGLGATPSGNSSLMLPAAAAPPAQRDVNAVHSSGARVVTSSTEADAFSRVSKPEQAAPPPPALGAPGQVAGAGAVTGASAAAFRQARGSTIGASTGAASTATATASTAAATVAAHAAPPGPTAHVASAASALPRTGATQSQGPPDAAGRDTPAKPTSAQPASASAPVPAVAPAGSGEVQPISPTSPAGTSRRVRSPVHLQLPDPCACPKP